MDDVVTVDAGRLRGTSSSDSTVRSFLGVPYAAPPVGDLRWRPPQPVPGWSGIRDATAYGPASRQPAIPGNSLYYGHETRFSEDCLYLNVWTGSVSGTAGPSWFGCIQAHTNSVPGRTRFMTGPPSPVTA